MLNKRRRRLADEKYKNIVKSYLHLGNTWIGCYLSTFVDDLRIRKCQKWGHKEHILSNNEVICLNCGRELILTQNQLFLKLGTAKKRW